MAGADHSPDKKTPTFNAFSCAIQFKCHTFWRGYVRERLSSTRSVVAARILFRQINVLAGHIGGINSGLKGKLEFPGEQ
jgi:hypothetical protein